MAAKSKSHIKVHDTGPSGVATVGYPQYQQPTVVPYLLGKSLFQADKRTWFITKHNVGFPFYPYSISTITLYICESYTPEYIFTRLWD